MATTHAIRGTVKRAANGKLVAEIGAHMLGPINQHDVVRIGGAEYTVKSWGSPFKVGHSFRDRVTKVYLYLAEPTTAPTIEQPRRRYCNECEGPCDGSCSPLGM